MSLQDDLDSIKASEAQIDAVSNDLSDEVTTTVTYVQSILSQIPSSATTEESSALAAQASAELAKLSSISAALKAVSAPVVTDPPIDPGTGTTDPNPPVTTDPTPVTDPTTDSAFKVERKS